MYKGKYRVKIIAPASGHNEAYNIISEACEWIEQYKEFDVTYNEDIFAETNPPFYSNIRDYRYRDLYEALVDDDVDIIWCFRGGYGSMELIDEKLLALQPQNKILIGFSDITALHFLFAQQYNLISIHGPHFNKISQHKPEVDYIVDYLGNKELSYKISAYNDVAHFNTSLEGKIIGGNLAIISHIIATELHPDLKDKILLIEDTNEASYAIHRMLTQLQQTNILWGAKAILIGDFIAKDQYLDIVLQQFAAVCSLPVFRIHSVGHKATNYPIVFNHPIQINNGNLIISGRNYASSHY
jgi:muramoyltetrapeptide carboxypeptidase LdcA involved in peptidoglycan recycling